MNLDKLQINATLRSGWQALDLGMLMARAWFRPLYLAGLLPMLPLTLVLLLVFRDQPFWALFIIWWLKPFWERLPLFIASRLTFAESPDLWSSMKSFPLKDAIPWLLWRRFSMQRAFDNPVTVLEGLKGRARRQRLRVLHGKYSDVALSNQLVGFLCEWLLAFGLLVTIEFFIPESLDLRFHDAFGDLTLTGQWFLTVAMLFAMTLVLPFHSMAGFALYLNRRIELEAWDIEISFRNLAQRKQASRPTAPGVATVLMLSALLLSAAPITADAATDHNRESARQLVSEVLDGEDFGRERTVSKWRFKEWFPEEEEELEKFPEWIIDFLVWLESTRDWWDWLVDAAYWVKILLVVLFAALLFYLLRRFRAPLARLAGGKKAEAPPEMLFGLDVTPESLPRDVPEQVLELWANGNGREALSLLYRAALSRLIDRYQVAFRSSHTEAECASLVRARGIDSLSRYFAELTGVWQRLAYGHLLPADAVVRGLCERWSEELANGAQ